MTLFILLLFVILPVRACALPTGFSRLWDKSRAKFGHDCWFWIAVPPEKSGGFHVRRGRTCRGCSGR